MESYSRDIDQVEEKVCFHMVTFTNSLGLENVTLLFNKHRIPPLTLYPGSQKTLEEVWEEGQNQFPNIPKDVTLEEAIAVATLNLVSTDILKDDLEPCMFFFKCFVGVLFLDIYVYCTYISYF